VCATIRTSTITHRTQHGPWAIRQAVARCQQAGLASLRAAATTHVADVQQRIQSNHFDIFIVFIFLETHFGDVLAIVDGNDESTRTCVADRGPRHHLLVRTYHERSWNWALTWSSSRVVVVGVCTRMIAVWSWLVRTEMLRIILKVAEYGTYRKGGHRSPGR